MRYMLVDFLEPFRFITAMQKQMWMVQSNIFGNAWALLGENIAGLVITGCSYYIIIALHENYP